MITLNEWQAAKEEFKDGAFKRFCFENGATFTSNGEVESDVIGWRFVMFKPLPELYAHDVSVYGKNAYLMWEMKADVKGCIPLKHNDFFRLGSNCAFGQQAEYRRKTSAALPFDLERAKTGCVIEYFNGEIWTLCIDVKECHGTEIAKITSESGIDHHIGFNNLRMKYPPEVK